MDDNADISYILTKMLKRLHFEVEVASNGNEALGLFNSAIAKNRPFNSVIMDLKVTDGMGGEEAISLLLRLYPEAKIILCSGSISNQLMLDYRKYGISAVIRKPFKMNDLRSALQIVNNE